jgi:hypothetical protein
MKYRPISHASSKASKPLPHVSCSQVVLGTPLNQLSKCLDRRREQLAKLQHNFNDVLIEMITFMPVICTNLLFSPPPPIFNGDVEK